MSSYSGNISWVPLSIFRDQQPLTEEQEKEKKEGDAQKIELQEIVCDMTDECQFFIAKITPENERTSRQAMLRHLVEEHQNLNAAGNNSQLGISYKVLRIVCPECGVNGIGLYQRPNKPAPHYIRCFSECQKKPKKPKNAQ